MLDDRWNERFSDSARRAMAVAQEEAQRLGHRYLGTEHLLLGLVRVEEERGAGTLRDLGVDLAKARNAVEFIIGRGPGGAAEPPFLTPRLRLVVELATAEAGWLGDARIDAEHLLLGLVREGEGIAAGVLESMGADLGRVRRQALRALGLPPGLELEQEMTPSLSASPAAARAQGMERNPMQNDRFDKFSQRARAVLALAQEEARRFNHNYIGTEHLLLGLVREQEGVAAQVLRNLGVELNKVREAIEFTIRRGDRAPIGEIGMTPRARKVIELAVDEARRLGHRYIGTEHLLLGLVREGEGIAGDVLIRLGVDLEKIRQQTVMILSQGGPSQWRSGARMTARPGAQPGSAAGGPAEAPPPELGELLNVIAMGQFRHHGPDAITALSIERYERGFLLVLRVVADTKAPPPIAARFPFCREGLTAEDDDGRRYARAWQGAREYGREWRFDLRFTPALEPTARELRLGAPAVGPASAEAPAADPSLAGPWQTALTLPGYA